MLLSALRSYCKFIFDRLLEGDQLNMCVCVRVRACVLITTSVSPLATLYSMTQCTDLTTAVFIFKTPYGCADTNVDVISLTAVRKVRPFFRRFSRKSPVCSVMTCRSVAPRFHSNRARNVGSTNRNFCTPVSKRGYRYGEFPESYN
jgi:hypothetical protein